MHDVNRRQPAQTSVAQQQNHRLAPRGTAQARAGNALSPPARAIALIDFLLSLK
ncbi:MAG: hypothetical protein ACOH18_01495 [Candidatus Saccharimonadaceae bacterium]